MVLHLALFVAFRGDTHTNSVVEKLSPPFNPLSVSVQANGKKRPILDLFHVNKYLVKRKVKYEDWKVALAFFQKDCYMVLFDRRDSRRPSVFLGI